MLHDVGLGQGDKVPGLISKLGEDGNNTYKGDGLGNGPGTDSVPNTPHFCP